MKKNGATVLLLLLFSGTVFFLGWIQFSVPAGKYGVLLSKTSGIDPDPVLPARFRWQWEKLIPTNTELFVFDLAPVVTELNAGGELPSGSLYSGMLEGNPDFSWKMVLTVTGRVKPEALPGLVERLGIKDQGALDNWAKERLSTAADGAGRLVISAAMSDPASFSSIGSDPAILAETVRIDFEAKKNIDEIEILSVRPGILKFPDFTLYAIAARTYGDYQSKRSGLLAQTAAAEADASVSEYLQIERFARWGEVLTKYPILIDFLAVARDDAAEAFKAVKSLK